LWNRLEKMADFVAATMDEGGSVPAIGDDDEGYVARLSFDRGHNPYRSLLATAAALFGRKDFARKAGLFDEQSFWLLGPAGKEAFKNATTALPAPSAFRHGGYYFLHLGRSRLLFDCGPLGYLSLAAHGHADALSIILDYKGRRFLVDPGTYAYHTQADWRAYFRGTSAHNTVRLEGQDQSVIGGNFMWSRKADAELLWADEERLHGRHDGYLRLPQQAVHEREIIRDKAANSYCVIDTIMARGPVTVDQFFHLAPDCHCEEIDGGFAIANGDAEIGILVDPCIPNRRILRESTAPIGGWYSPGFDRKVPTSTIWLQFAARGDCTLTTRIVLR
jgi:hypothetical protein